MLKSVQGLIDNITALSELLSIAMHLDVERLKNRVDNSDEMSAEAEECDKRMVSWASLVQHDVVLMINFIFSEF